MIDYFNKVKFAKRFGDLEAENAELKLQNSQQDKEIFDLKSKILNLELILPNQFASNYAIGHSPNMNDTPLWSRALSRPPSSCQEWLDGSSVLLADGIYLIQNLNTKKIEAVFCQKSAINRANTCKILYYLR